MWKVIQRCSSFTPNVILKASTPKPNIPVNVASIHTNTTYYAVKKTTSAAGGEYGCWIT